MNSPRDFRKWYPMDSGVINHRFEKEVHRLTDFELDYPEEETPGFELPKAIRRMTFPEHSTPRPPLLEGGIVEDNTEMIDTTKLVPQYYRMDPKTDVLIGYADRLKEGMEVLIEDPIHRANLKQIMSSESQLDMALRMNRWCTVSDLRIDGSFVMFVGVYSDGTSHKHSCGKDIAWIAKKDSVSKGTEESDDERDQDEWIERHLSAWRPSSHDLDTREKFDEALGSGRWKRTPLNEIKKIDEYRLKNRLFNTYLGQAWDAIFNDDELPSAVMIDNAKKFPELSKYSTITLLPWSAVTFRKMVEAIDIQDVRTKIEELFDCNCWSSKVLIEVSEMTGDNFVKRKILELYLQGIRKFLQANPEADDYLVIDHFHVERLQDEPTIISNRFVHLVNEMGAPTPKDDN